uniref:CCHC-type domain-containing protein n=1 Tax=Sparus aurata TaxID=8175 RepID=A0A671XAU5_SPAAU
MASAPSHANRRNAVRFDLLEDLQMDRLQFSRQILQKELGISTNQLDYLFAFPGKKIFEVIFTTTQHYESCLEKFEKKKSAPSFRRITISPLADIDLKTVHVMIFSERVRNQDVWTWMARYCEVINAMEVMDIDGIKTGTRRFQVRLIRRQGALQHLPNTIQLGAFRGSVFYPGQPKECRKCGSLDHLAAACTMDVCRNCKALDHTTAHCPTPVKCNLCSSANHRFKDCPQAYSNRLKLSTLRSAVSLSQEVMSEIPDDDQAPIPHANQVQQGSWKLNISLLQDEKVVSEFRVKLNHWLSLKPFFNLAGEWWEEMKIRAKRFFIDWGKRTAKKRRLKLQKHKAKLQRFYMMSYSGLMWQRI